VSRNALWRISAGTAPEAEDALSDLFQDLFQQPATSYTDMESGVTTVAVYLPKPPARGFQTALRDGLARIRRCGLKVGNGKISLKRIRREDWAESWKRHFHPLEIGSALLIKPSWNRRRPRKQQALVILDPGLSFGTGQHPTTAFCLRQAASLRPRDTARSFLDIGTGSGILAIAAAKLGYSPVDAFDFDPEAVRVARKNLQANRVSAKVRLTRADITRQPLRPPRQYDLVCANLISTLLIAERERIVARLKRDGVLVLAGILKKEFALVQRAFEKAGLRLIASRVEKEWRSGAFRSTAFSPTGVASRKDRQGRKAL